MIGNVNSFYEKVARRRGGLSGWGPLVIVLCCPDTDYIMNKYLDDDDDRTSRTGKEKNYIVSSRRRRCLSMRRRRLLWVWTHQHTRKQQQMENLFYSEESVVNENCGHVIERFIMDRGERWGLPGPQSPTGIHLYQSGARRDVAHEPTRITSEEKILAC